MNNVAHVCKDKLLPKCSGFPACRERRSLNIEVLLHQIMSTLEIGFARNEDSEKILSDDLRLSLQLSAYSLSLSGFEPKTLASIKRMK